MSRSCSDTALCEADIGVGCSKLKSVMAISAKRVFSVLRLSRTVPLTMTTFVCELCHDEELNSHPQLGSAWNLDWYLAMAALARKTGWSTVPPPDRRADWFFREFQVVGPRCGRR